MAMIQVTSTDNLELIVRYADTQVVAYLNGDEIYSRYGSGEGPFDEHTSLAQQLRKGYNVLTVLGLRWEKNYKYDVEVVLNGRVLKSVESTAPRENAGNGIVWDFSVELNNTG